MERPEIDEEEGVQGGVGERREEDGGEGEEGVGGAENVDEE